MFKPVKFVFLLSLIINIASCSNTNKNPVIKFSADSNLIIIKKIDETSLYQVKNNLSLDSSNLVSILSIPNVTDSLQDEEKVSGTLKLLADSIVFTPEENFIKGKTYIVETYLGTSFADKNKLFKGKITHNLQPYVQVLKR
ncbi:hypothetical protein [Pedobacter aquatilis]|uniref:hypothetical protein n=1 Tax=Pedobacter aquatilis TaxID=351343 RepID=UPI00292DCED8|nr:hypothetical protein [Pedobacter aquatilis]